MRMRQVERKSIKCAYRISQYHLTIVPILHFPLFKTYTFPLAHITRRQGAAIEESS